MTAVGCPACGGEVGAGDHYCEACGADLTAPSTADISVVPGRWLTSVGGVTTCAGCGGTGFSPEGYCENCGERRGSAKDHAELDLGPLAAATDRGLRHHRNEDAVGLGLVGDLAVAIVCDGVSSSDRPDSASCGAVTAAVTALDRALRDGAAPADAIGAATRAAQAAATLAAGPQPGENPPSSTFVCAVVGPDAVTVGWVGDSRAYWVPAGGEPECLTVDDARAGALLRWLGADAPDTRPHVRVIIPAGPGRVLVCSDGLFKYPTALAGATVDGAPLANVQSLVRLALDAGGADNITAAFLPYPAPTDQEQP